MTLFKMSLKDRQMKLISTLPPEKAKDALLTLAWKSKTKLVQQVLVERGIITDPLGFAQESLAAGDTIEDDDGK